MIPLFLSVIPFLRGARGILFGFFEAFLGVIPLFLSVILAGCFRCDSGVLDEARRFVQRRLHRRGRLRVKDGSCIASWCVVREDLLIVNCDAGLMRGTGRGAARTRQGGVLQGGARARSCRPCSMCATATRFVRLREAFPWLDRNGACPALDAGAWLGRPSA